MQYVDRSRGAGRHDRPGREDLRLHARPRVRAEGKRFRRSRGRWRQLPSDAGAKYDRVEVFNAADIAPQVTWGTNPGQVVPVIERVPDPAKFETETNAKPPRVAGIHGPGGGQADAIAALDRVFIGSCTNSRIEDLRAAAAVVRGYHVANTVHAMVVPGSGQVKKQAEKEGSTRFSKRPASIGAKPVAACAWG